MVFEPTIPALEQVKTDNALDRAATVIGNLMFPLSKYEDCCLLEFPDYMAAQPRGQNS
jgi:hypothetical protein